MNITVHDPELAEDAALEASLRLCANHRPAEAHIYVEARVPEDAPAHRHPGWLEYIIALTYPSGSKLTVGMIERSPGSGFEFHS